MQSDDPRRVRYRFLPYKRDALRDPDLPRKMRVHERLVASRYSIPQAAADSLIIELAEPPLVVIEQWHCALTRVINGRARIAYLAAVTGLARSERRLLRDRFDFLLDSNVTCVALNKESASFGLEALVKFLETNNPKRAFRNTLNDMLILGIAASLPARLSTEDKLLGKFAATCLGARQSDQGSYVNIDFDACSRDGRPSRESKGYINPSWRIRQDGTPWL